MKNSIRHKVSLTFLTGLTLAFILSSCNPTKYVPADKMLLNKYHTEVSDKSVKTETLKSYIKQKPNKRIFGWIRFHLGLYNLSNIKKDKGIHKFLRKIGEEPVIYDPYLTEKSLGQLDIYMKNKGYYNARISDSVYFNGKKANIFYYLDPGKPYLVNDITYAIKDSGIRRQYFADTTNNLIKRGDKFDKDAVLQNERTRIERLMKLNGYYNFSREYVFFNWDSAFHKVNVEVQIENPINTSTGKESYHRQYKIRNILVTGIPDPSDPNSYNSINKDTIEAGTNVFLTDIKKLRINPKSFVQFIYIQSGRLYNENSIEETYTHISSLNLFKLVDIKFSELNHLPDTSSFLWLDCNIRLSPAVPQSYSADLEGTNSSGNIGGGVHFNYRHINLFGNAEVLDLKLRGSIESLRERNTNKYAPTQEFGIESNIKFPTFLIPARNKNFIKKYNPKTLLSLSYNYQDRPEFIRTVANVGFGYNWKQSRFQEHIFRPLELNFVNIKNSPDFEKLISGTYLESSYRDHLITNMSYSYIYNSQNIKKNQDFDYFRVNIESAGNTLSLFNSNLTQTNDSISSYYQVLGIQYSQYLKTDFEYKYYNIINPTNNIVYRFFAGVAYPYGNARAIPFEKKYFSGGANGLRGWQARSLGPGTSIEDTASQAKYPNSTGDIKIELNFEYRFKLFWKLEGAFFMDAGNIWAIRKEDNREGGWFQPNTFYKELALDSGLGFRFDFSFFIFRTDIGMKMRDPSRPSGDRWILGNRKLVRDDFAFQIGIGYPF